MLQLGDVEHRVWLQEAPIIAVVRPNSRSTAISSFARTQRGGFGGRSDEDGEGYTLLWSRPRKNGD